MRCLALATLFVVTACAPLTSALESPSVPPSTPSAAASLPEPSVAVAPPSNAVPDHGRIPQPDITVAGGTFAILTTLRPKLATVDEAVILAARGGVES